MLKKQILNKPQVSIVVTTCNALEYTKRCIKSIRKYTKKSSYELIIVDNNSGDGTVKYLKNLKNVKLVLNRKNLGAGSAARQGILACRENSRYIIFLDNDTEILDKDWLYSMAEYLENNPKIGCLGPKYYLPHDHRRNSQSDKIKVRCMKKLIFDPKRVKKISGRNFSKKELSRLFTFINEDNKLVSAEIGGWCQMHRRHLINKIGLPEDALLPQLKLSFWDGEYSMRYLLFGYRIENFDLEKSGKILHYGQRCNIFKADHNKYRYDFLIHEKLTGEIKKMALLKKPDISEGIKKFLLFLYDYLDDDIYGYFDLKVFSVYSFWLNHYMSLSKFKFDKCIPWLYYAFLHLFKGANEEAVILIKAYLDLAASKNKKDRIFLAEALYKSARFEECFKVYTSLQKYSGYKPLIAKRKRQINNLRR